MVNVGHIDVDLDYGVGITDADANNCFYSIATNVDRMETIVATISATMDYYNSGVVMAESIFQLKYFCGERVEHICHHC